MTPKQAQKLLPVIQAFSLVAKIQCKINPHQDSWKDIEDPTWLEDMSYRIKPQRARVWLDNYSHLLIVCKESDWEATKDRIRFGGWKSEPFDLTED